MEAFLKNTVPVMEFKPFRETIYEYLRQQILSGNLRREFSSPTEKSRNCSRQAEHRSGRRFRNSRRRTRGAPSHEGEHRQGTFTRGNRPIYSIRKALELLAIRYATLRITPRSLTQ
jgi:DNA-binding GntR family transcriptional regulator